MSEDRSSILEKYLQKLSEVVGAQPAKTEQLIPGERRDVAILFLDLTGFTAMSETMDHEMVHKIIGGVMNALSNNVKGHGGYVDKIEGDLIMALFGAKEANENDCIRAVACGLRMFEVIREVNQIFSAKGYEIGARCGINYGSVTVAPDATGHTTAMGDGVNLASRLESTAEVNTVQVTARVQKECGDYFDWEDLGEITVKGKKQPVHTYRPTGPGKVQKERWERAARVSRSPMVGREKEMEILKSWWDKQTGEFEKNRRGGAKHFVLSIKAEAGIGKSRLVHEFVKSVEEQSPLFSREGERAAHPPLQSRGGIKGGVTILRGQTLSYAQPPFWLWITLLRNYFGIGSGDPDAKEKFEKIIKDIPELKDSAPFLSELLSIASDDPRQKHLDDKAKHQETLIALRNLVRALGKQQRTVIILEDLHWLDSASKEAIEFVLTNCDSEKPLLCLCLYRPEEETTLPKVHKNYIISDGISLSPIDENACIQLIGFMLGSASSGVEKFLLKQSQGNPFFLEELILDMIESGSLKESAGKWSFAVDEDKISIPSAMSGLLRSRIDRLPSEQKQGLQHTSVLGFEFLLKLYRRMVEKLESTGQAEQILSELERRDFISNLEDHSELKYIFKHILTHNAAYDTILHHNRAVLHRLTAEAIEELFPDELESFSGIIANHWDRAGDSDKTIEWGMKALKHCEKTFQNDEGLRWANRLIERIQVKPESRERDETLFEIWGIETEILYLLDRTEEQIQKVGKQLCVAKKWSLRSEQCDILMGLGYLYRNKGNRKEAQKYLEEALILCRKVSYRRVEGAILNCLGMIKHDKGRTEEALKLYNDALKVSQEFNEPLEQWYILSGIGEIHKDRGEYKEAFELVSQALAIVQNEGGRFDEAFLLSTLADLIHVLGNSEKALQNLHKALEIYQELGADNFLGWQLTKLGGFLGLYGRPEDAENFHQQAAEKYHEIGQPVLAAMAMIELGERFMEQGRNDVAMQCFQETFDNGHDLKISTIIALSLIAIGTWQSCQDKLDIGLNNLEKGIEMLQNAGWSRDHMIQSLCAYTSAWLEKKDLGKAGELICEMDNYFKNNLFEPKRQVHYYSARGMYLAIAKSKQDFYLKETKIKEELAGSPLKEYLKAHEIIERMAMARTYIYCWEFAKLRTVLLDAGIPPSDLPLPKHWEEATSKL